MCQQRPSAGLNGFPFLACSTSLLLFFPRRFLSNLDLFFSSHSCSKLDLSAKLVKRKYQSPVVGSVDIFSMHICGSSTRRTVRSVSWRLGSGRCLSRFNLLLSNFRVHPPIRKVRHCRFP
ncbi:Protein of unknown function [Pyronema omphalodes CBS 100304]|uniref:Uncharacterized protein n=1 Tax=Pyronema omphalodes (strain CBS 100304) TaxID=1076935 RepID=U4KYI2_PYROM|nr:Protein of unknown function [Pyronema omphalodes CBS 100304]